MKETNIHELRHMRVKFEFEMYEKQSKQFLAWMSEQQVLPLFKDLKTFNLSLIEERALLELLFKRQSKFDALENFTNNRKDQFSLKKEGDTSFMSYLNLSNLKEGQNDENFIS